MPNTFAYVMLLVWPLVSIGLFRSLRPTQAAVWTILAGYLLLPPNTKFDLPLLPDLDKFGIANLCAFLGFLRTTKAGWGLPRSLLARVALLIFIATPIGTVLANLDYIPLAIGGLPPMILQEIPAGILTNLLAIMPLFIGYHLLREEQGMRDLIVALFIAGLAYSVPMLLEVIIGPQINVYTYGFLQHALNQTIRYGGFRPIVFLPHGLWVAFFAFMTAVAAATLLKTDDIGRKKKASAFLYLLAVLLLCKSANAIIYALIFIPALFLLPRNAIVRISAAIGTVVLLYPLLRGAGLIPTEMVADFAQSLDPERAYSFVFRLNNEDLLLAHAAKRPWFGWGSWGRNLLFDPITGRMLTITDGFWIILIGIQGWFGYIGEFGLLTLPLLLLAGRATTHGRTVSPYVCAISAMLAANLIDLIPNATIVPLTWLMAGALLGYADALVPVTAKAPRASRRAFSASNGHAVARQQAGSPDGTPVRQVNFK